MSRTRRRARLFAGAFTAALGAGTFTTTPANAAEPERARDDDDGVSRPALALVVGGATSFVSLAGGVMALARSETRSAKNEGLIAGQAGLTLAPIFAHAVTGELARGFLFALIPLAGVAANVTLAATIPDFIAHAGPPVQYTAFSGIAVSIFGATIGVLDAVRVGERTQASSAGAFLRDLRVSPIVARTEAGLAVGGSL